MAMDFLFHVSPDLSGEKYMVTIVSSFLAFDPEFAVVPLNIMHP